MRQTIMLLLGVAAITFGGVWLAGSFGDDDVAPIVDAGNPEYGLGTSFADLSFTDLGGTDLDFASYAPGSPMIVFVRDALCPVSRRYGPETARIEADYSELGYTRST